MCLGPWKWHQASSIRHQHQAKVNVSARPTENKSRNRISSCLAFVDELTFIMRHVKSIYQGILIPIPISNPYSLRCCTKTKTWQISREIALILFLFGFGARFIKAASHAPLPHPASMLIKTDKGRITGNRKDSLGHPSSGYLVSGYLLTLTMVVCLAVGGSLRPFDLYLNAHWGHLVFITLCIDANRWRNLS